MRFSALAMTSVLVLATTIAAQESNRGQAKGTVGRAHLVVYYGSPALQGRDMLSQAPPGTLWRLGKDTATMLETDADLRFGDLVVPAGSYTLFARRVDEKNWELIVNEQTGQWGTEHDDSMDLGHTPLIWESKGDSTEQFTIEVASVAGGGELRFIWGTHVLKAKFIPQ
jgi:hypothetical protein